MRLLRSMEAPRAIYLAAAFSIASLGLASTANAALVVSTNATKNVSCSAGVCTATALHAVLNVNDLQTLLASGSVKLMSGSVGGNIDVNAALTWANGSSLTLDAYASISVIAHVTVAGTAPLTLTTADGGSEGSLNFQKNGRISFLGTSNTLTINGNIYTLVDDISMMASDMQSNQFGNYALSDNYNAKVDGIYALSAIPFTFEGSFEGLGNTISHLSISNPHSGGTGFFQGVGGGDIESIRDLHLANVNILDSGGNSDAYSPVGGLAARVGSSITVFNCSVSGRIRSSKFSIAGGLVGINGGLVSTSYSTATVAGGTVGGLIGANKSGSILDSYASGLISGVGNASYVGGLIGANVGSVSQSYAMGGVTGSSLTGGLIGQDTPASGESVTQVYSTGAVSQTHTFGGLVGQDTSAAGTFGDAYWDETTSGVTSSSKGAGTPANDPGITGLSNTQLTSASPAGFDPSIWAQSPSINNGLPYLIANPPR